MPGSLSWSKNLQSSDLRWFRESGTAGWSWYTAGTGLTVFDRFSTKGAIAATAIMANAAVGNL